MSDNPVGNESVPDDTRPGSAADVPVHATPSAPESSTGDVPVPTEEPAAQAPEEATADVTDPTPQNDTIEAPEADAPTTTDAGVPAEPATDAAADVPEEPAAEAATEPAAAPAAAPAADEATSTDVESAAAPEAPTPATTDDAAPAAEEASAPVPGDAAAAPAEAAPAAPKPTPRAVPRPPKRGRVTPATTGRIAPAVPPPPDLSEEDALHAATFGRVDEEGRVFVREAAGEREVGQYPDAPAAEALAFYVRRFADLHAKVGLFEARLAATDLGVKEIDTTLEGLTAELEAPAAVGDLDGLRARLATLRERAEARRAAVQAERAAAKAAAASARTELVESAEKIAATDPAKMQWRPAGEQLRTLLEQWKEAQRHGPRLDRATEDALWKRFSHARSTFDRERRRWFAELEKANTAAREAKERIVAEAEALATSTDWGATSAAYRDLMTRWKAAGRASRKDDDALWARFRAAQDAFFAARDAHHRATDAEFGANLEQKLALLEEAERLVPIKDLAAAKAELRSIQDRWEKIGKVPRGDVQRVEGRLRAVEQAVRDAEQARWQRTNPETRARAEGAAAQLVAAIANLEADLEKARAAGDARKVADLEESLAARRAWLEQVERAAAESRG